MSERQDKSVWLTRDEMRDICPSCADEMAEKRLTKIKVRDPEGNFLKAGFSEGLCDKFGGASGFRTRCMSSMEGKVDDSGAFCNALKIRCHGSAGAEGKRDKILIKDEKSRYTLGIVYEPDTLDTDNEFADAATIEKACWDFMRHIQNRGEAARAALDFIAEIDQAAKSEGDVEIELDNDIAEIAKMGVNAMHVKELEDSEVVESYIAPADMKIGDEEVKKGSWLLGIIWDPEHFKKIEAGEWTGYSMGGWAKKEDA